MSGSTESTSKAKKSSESKHKPRVRIIFGTATWGLHSQCTKDVATKQLQTLLNTDIARVTEGPEAGKILIDTARLYQSGESEGVLGEILKENPTWRARISIHTKANPFQSKLNREGLTHQLNTSLKALGLDYVDIFYLHQPDINTSIEETFQTCHDLYKEGKFKELGLSNYASWDVVRIYHLCTTKGWVLPTVYQGMYNAITRSIEPELMPALKTYGIRSYWYNPLAAGILTGKYTSSAKEKPAEGRFSDKFDFVSPADKDNWMKGLGAVIYRQRYWKQRLLDSIEVIREACEKENIPMTDAAIRWLVHHSVLKGNHHDGVLFGASSVAQVETNLKAYAGSELPKPITDAFDSAWQVAAPEAESYMRGYGAKPGTSELYLSKL